MEVQWLRLRTFTAKGMGSIPGQGTKDPASHVVPTPRKKKYIIYICYIYIYIIRAPETLENFSGDGGTTL